MSRIQRYRSVTNLSNRLVYETGCFRGVTQAQSPRYCGDMSMNAVEIERALLALSREERAAVIHRGLLSLNSPTPSADQPESLDAAWAEELQERVRQIDDGDVSLIDADESHARLRAELSSRRR